MIDHGIDGVPLSELTDRCPSDYQEDLLDLLGLLVDYNVVVTF